MSILPNSRPQLATTAVLALASAAWQKYRPDSPEPARAVLAIRGYYSKTFAPDGNNLGVYDDALFIINGPKVVAWNGNVDPSRQGWNGNAGKFMARLALGVWDFVRLKHHASRPNGYMAFGQGENPVTVERCDGAGVVRQIDHGCFGINLHRGGDTGTSSEGCLTVPTEQWTGFDKELSYVILPTNRFQLILIDA